MQVSTRSGCRNLVFGFASEKGNFRPNNEDVLLIIPDMRPIFPQLCNQYNVTKNPFGFFGVFDGHGGKEAAIYAEENLPEIILTLHLREKLDITEALKEAILILDEEFIATGKEDGSTLLVILITPDGRLISANVGDSEGFIYSSHLDQLETLCPLGPHNPKKNIAEEQRIILSGGSLMAGRLCHPQFGSARTIAVSRALGDASFKQGPVTCLIPTPDIMERHLTGKETAILMACDGLWDVFQMNEVATLLTTQTTKDPYDISRHLIEEAYRRGTTDNVTILLILIDP